MLARSRCALLVVALASVGGFMAVGGAAPAVPWAEVGRRARRWRARGDTVDRMTPQTSMCAADDGSFHRVVYGVGGGGFDFRPSVPVPVTRDIDCSDYGVTTLGDKGARRFDEHGVRRPAPTRRRARCTSAQALLRLGRGHGVVRRWPIATARHERARRRSPRSS
jgi:hypothetical protein